MTVLDFVGVQRREFRFDQKFRALTGVTRKGLREGVEKGFSYLPPGCDVSLDEASREVILENLNVRLILRGNRWFRSTKSMLWTALEGRCCSLFPRRTMNFQIS